jgi:MYXO-CTERM domain-containing protein
VDLPPPIVIALDGDLSGYLAWTSYTTPASLWKELPVHIAFAGDPGVSGDLRDLLDVSARAWSTPACSGARIVADATRMMPPSGGDGVNDIIVHKTDWPPPLATGAAGHTVIFTMGDRVVEADIHLNARDFAFSVGVAPPKIDLQAILTHELGHVLGIGHSADPRATMNAGLPGGIAARSLEKDDVDAVCTLYPGTGGGCTTCPSGFSCVGHTCERPSEPSVNGAPCADGVRRCDGAGDIARCIASSLGERCARPCPPDCGVGLSCVIIGVDDSVCLPIGATVDAGVDASSDAAVSPAPPSGDGCACTTSAPPRTPWLMLVAFLIAWRLRFERR